MKKHFLLGNYWYEWYIIEKLTIMVIKLIKIELCYTMVI